MLRSFHAHGKIIFVTLPATTHPPIALELLEVLKDLWHATESKQALDLVTQMYAVDGTSEFMTLFSNTKSGHWLVVAKANSSALSTGLWNAIDTDAVDTARLQAGTFPQFLAVRSSGSRKGPHWVWTVLYLLHISCYCDTTQSLGPFYFF